MSNRPSIHRLIELFPDDRERLVAAAERIARLSRACGCTEGAIATSVAMAFVAIYWLWPNCCPLTGQRVSLLWSIPFVLAAAGAGKLLGIGVARLRLVLVYRQLHAKYELRERHVHVHEMGRPGGHRV
jgi:hypothetical protein